MKIKRDWAGRPVEISFGEDTSKNFFIAYIDDSGVFKTEESIDPTLLPYFIGSNRIKQMEWEMKYIEIQKSKKDTQDRVLQTPRDRWDKEDKLKKNPYDYVVQKKEPELKEEDKNGN